MAVLNLLRYQFEGVKIVGCIFQHHQAVWKKVQDLGLSSLFYCGDDFQEMVPHGVCSLLRSGGQIGVLRGHYPLEDRVEAWPRYLLGQGREL